MSVLDEYCIKVTPGKFPTTSNNQMSLSLKKRQNFQLIFPTTEIYMKFKRQNTLGKLILLSF